MASVISIGHLSTNHLAAVTLGSMTSSVRRFATSLDNFGDSYEHLTLPVGHWAEYHSRFCIRSRLPPTACMDFES